MIIYNCSPRWLLYLSQLTLTLQLFYINHNLFKKSATYLCLSLSVQPTVTQKILIYVVAGITLSAQVTLPCQYGGLFVYKTSGSATSNWQPTPRSHGLFLEVLTVHGLYIYGQRLTAFLRVTFNSEKFAETRKVVTSKLISEWPEVWTIISTNFVFIRKAYLFLQLGRSLSKKSLGRSTRVQLMVQRHINLISILHRL